MQMKPHLSKCTFNLAEEIIIRHLRGLVVDVIHSKTQFLYLFKEIIQLKGTRKLRAQAIFHIFCPSKLGTQQLPT